LVGVREPGGFGNQGPKQVHHAARQAADRGKGSLSARANPGSVQGGLIGHLESPLGGHYKYGIGRHTGRQEQAQAFHTYTGLAAAGRPGEERFFARRGFNYFALLLVDFHRSRLSESEGFVNKNNEE
jgi:hypothetical protein